MMCSVVAKNHIQIPAAAPFIDAMAAVKTQRGAISVPEQMLPQPLGE